MRPHMAIIAAAAALFVLAGLAAPALARRLVPICTAAGTQGRPAIDGTRIVWEDLRDGTSTIYTYDLANPVPGGVPVCPTGTGQFYPAVSGDRVVWVDSNDDIYMYVLANPTPGPVPICTHPAIQESPAISGDRIEPSEKPLDSCPVLAMMRPPYEGGQPCWARRASSRHSPICWPQAA